MTHDYTYNEIQEAKKRINNIGRILPTKKLNKYNPERYILSGLKSYVNKKISKSKAWHDSLHYTVELAK